MIHSGTMWKGNRDSDDSEATPLISDVATSMCLGFVDARNCFYLNSKCVRFLWLLEQMCLLFYGARGQESESHLTGGGALKSRHW